MVDFYVVYDAVEDFGGWHHLTTNAEDGYTCWYREDDPRYEMVFFNWDLDDSDEGCGIRIDSRHDGESKDVLELFLDDLDPRDIEDRVIEFLDDAEDIL